MWLWKTPENSPIAGVRHFLREDTCTDTYAENLLNVLRQNSMLGLMALGMTFVILTAGIDLSVGSLLAVAGIVGATLSPRGTFVALAGGVAAVADFAIVFTGVVGLGVALFIATKLYKSAREKKGQ